LPHNRKNGRVGYISQLNGNRGISEYLLRKICGLIGVKIFYNGLQISEGTNSDGFSDGFGLLLMCCYALVAVIWQ